MAAILEFDAHASRGPLWRLLHTVGNMLAFAGVTAAVGLATSWYAMEYGTRWSTRAVGPWVQWVTAGRPDADPYARAHAARKGFLPISSVAESSYRANVDSGGVALSSACEYAITVEGFGGAWWSLAAYGNDKGHLAHNAAERYAFSEHTAMREPDGHIVIMLARDARPGNWLPISGGGRINLVLTVLNSTGAAPKGPPALPEIQKLGCR